MKLRLKDIKLSNKQTEALRHLYKVKNIVYIENNSECIHILGKLYFNTPFIKLVYSKTLGKWISIYD